MLRPSVRNGLAMNHLLVGLLAIALVTLTGCDGYTSVGGQIVDGDGTPISGANVTLSYKNSHVSDGISDSDGKFHAAGTHAPTHDPIDMSVQKKGFKDDLRRLPANDHNESMRVVLERDSQKGRAP